MSLHSHTPTLLHPLTTYTTTPMLWKMFVIHNLCQILKVHHRVHTLEWSYTCTLHEIVFAFRSYIHKAIVTGDLIYTHNYAMYAHSQ